MERETMIEGEQELRAGCLFTESSEEAIISTLSVVRSGKSLTPASWPGNARVAVAITFDVDHEFPVYKLDPSLLSLGEYGATTAMPRILGLLSKLDVPATFFVPGMAQQLHPQTVPDILSSGRHEVGLHGWVHERAPDLRDRAEEEDMIAKSIEVLTNASGGIKPRGYRAPNSALSVHTLSLLDEFGIQYDSTLSGRDEPHEILVNGESLNLIEIPMSWENTDYLFLHNDEFWQGSLPWPKAVLDVYIADFEMAYEEGTVFNLVLHPQVIGRRSRIGILEQLIKHIQAKENIWFATLGDIAEFAGR